MSSVLVSETTWQRCVSTCRVVSEARWVTRGLIAVIIGNALLLGLDAGIDPADLPSWSRAAHAAITVVFLLELTMRLVAHSGRMREFARDGWNWFDVIVIVGSTVPAVGAWAQVARLMRVLRVLRLVSVAPQLRLMVATMIRSVPSLGSIGLLLSLILYVYAVIGVQLFAAVDAAHWGSLGSAFLTLFQVLTLEGWVELQRTAMTATPLAWIYFSSFVVVAVFVVVNLFIAVVLSNLESVRAEEAAAVQAAGPVSAQRSGPAESTDPAMAAQLATLIAEVSALRLAIELRQSTANSSSRATDLTLRQE
jgi:voltage-gated sodium channel